MLKIKDNVDLKELEKFGFYLEGNTYSYDIGKRKRLAICIIDRIILKPNLNRWNIKNKYLVDRIIFNMAISGIVEKVEE